MISTLLILTQFNISSAKQKRSDLIIGNKISFELINLMTQLIRQIQNDVLWDILQEDYLLFMLWKINLNCPTHLYVLTQVYCKIIIHDKNKTLTRL